MADGGVEPYLAPGTDPRLIDAYASLARRAGEASSLVEDELVFVDVETTGFDPDRECLVEIGAVRARGPEVLGTFRTFVDPGRPLPDHIVRLTGIGDEDLAGAPSPQAAVADLAAFAAGADLVGHNCAFDRAFLERAGGGPLPGRWLDSLELSRIALPRMRAHRLADLSDAFGLAPAVHRALDDAQATFGLWRVCHAGLELLPRDLVESLTRIAPDADWPLRDVLAASAARGRRTRAFDLKHLRAEARESGKARPLPDAEETDVIAPPARDVAGSFAADGLLGRMYPGFEPRDAQREMAEAVLEAFGEHTHLAVEAGTGVGKSVAYLVPAVRLALRNGVGVGVATRTNALLDQLMYRELPALARALREEPGLDAEPLRYVALKGYEHYPCLRKLDRLLAEAETPPVSIADVAATIAWVAQSPWDDLDALNVHRTEDYRMAVTSIADECAKRRCRFYPGLCYVHGIRQRAAAAHVVVTNHSLLFNDVALAGGILPPLRYWVVDEAHAAEDSARDQLSRRFSFAGAKGLLSGLTLRDRASVTAAVRAVSAPGAGGTPLSEDIAEAVTSLADQVASEASAASTVLGNFVEYVLEVPELAACRGGGSERMTDQLRMTGPFSSALAVGRSLVKRLTEVVRTGTELVSVLEEAGEDLAEQRSELRGRLGPLAGQLDALASFVNGDDPDYVYVVRVNRFGRPDTLVSARLQVGPALVSDFYPAVRSAVFTSATLAVGDDFGHFADEVGLDLLPEEQWRTLRLDSPYDLENQMTVYVSTDAGDPRDAGWIDRVAALLDGVHRSMGGSVLSLFTNRREMYRAYEAVVGPLAADGIQVRMQEGAGSVKRLRQEFLADEHLSLFATRSFWEGFDAPGDTLRCVVLAKLPFPNPNDPVMAELKEREPTGHFERHALPAAALDLKQAVGRLIRSSTDTGCVVIADSRLANRMRYAPVLLDALPVRGVEMLPGEEIVEQIALRFGR